MRHSTIIISVIAGILALGAIGGSWYALASIDSMKQSLAEGHDQLQTEEDRAQTVLDVKRQLKRLSTEREALGEYFFKEEDIVGLLERLEDLSRHANVEVAVTSAAPAESGGKPIFRTGMKVEGSWQDAMYFLSLLENLPFRLEITQVTLAGGETGGVWSGTVTLDLLSFVPKRTS